MVTDTFDKETTQKLTAPILYIINYEILWQTRILDIICIEKSLYKNTNKLNKHIYSTYYSLILAVEDIQLSYRIQPRGRRIGSQRNNLRVHDRHSIDRDLLFLRANSEWFGSMI